MAGSLEASNHTPGLPPVGGRQISPLGFSWEGSPGGRWPGCLRVGPSSRPQAHQQSQQFLQRTVCFTDSAECFHSVLTVPLLPDDLPRAWMCRLGRDGWARSCPAAFFPRGAQRPVQHLLHRCPDHSSAHSGPLSLRATCDSEINFISCYFEI